MHRAAWRHEDQRDHLGDRRGPGAQDDRARRRQARAAARAIRLALPRQLRPPGGRARPRIVDSGHGLGRSPRAGADGVHARASPTEVVDALRHEAGSPTPTASPQRGIRPARSTAWRTAIDELAGRPGLGGATGGDLDRARRAHDPWAGRGPRPAGVAARRPAPTGAAAPAADPGAGRASRRPAFCTTSSSSIPASTRGHSTSSDGGLLPIVDIARYAGARGRCEHDLDASSGCARRPTPGRCSRPTRRRWRRPSTSSRSCGWSTRSSSSTPGGEPDDHIDPKALNPLTRRYLRDAFRAVASVQRGLTASSTWDPWRASGRRSPVRAARLRRDADPAAPTPLARGRLRVLDLETTGLDPARDEIIAFADACRSTAAASDLEEPATGSSGPERMPAAETIRIHGLRSERPRRRPAARRGDRRAACEALTGRALVAHVAAVEERLPPRGAARRRARAAQPDDRHRRARRRAAVTSPAPPARADRAPARWPRCARPPRSPPTRRRR